MLWSGLRKHVVVLGRLTIVRSPHEAAEGFVADAAAAAPLDLHATWQVVILPMLHWMRPGASVVRCCGEIASVLRPGFSPSTGTRLNLSFGIFPGVSLVFLVEAATANAAPPTSEAALGEREGRGAGVRDGLWE